MSGNDFAALKPQPKAQGGRARSAALGRTGRLAHVPMGEECLRLNPSDGTIASRVPAMTVGEARAAVNRAALSFQAWAQLSGEARAGVLRQAAALFRAEAATFGALMQAEIGATAAWQEFNIAQAVRQLLVAAELAEGLPALNAQQVGAHDFLYREPVGVCLGIAPWNAPLALGVRAIATALACGNSVVLKASEICAGSHVMIADIMARAGLPAGVLHVVTHMPDQAEDMARALISHPAVRRVNFTGSSRVGRFVAGIAAEHLKRCLLELSGKAPQVVLADADLAAAADAAIYGGFLNQGQICMSTDRIIMDERIGDAYAALLVAQAKDLKAGPAGAKLGPVISEHMAQRLQDLVADAVAKGAKLLCGGTRRGAFVDATVLDYVTPGMKIYHEECFGPLLSLCRGETEAELLSYANDTSFGLAAAVWSRDIPRAMALARQIDAGMCHVNAPTLIDRPDMPVGGIKDSGYGRFGGLASLDEFTETRWINVGGQGVKMAL